MTQTAPVATSDRKNVEPVLGPSRFPHDQQRQGKTSPGPAFGWVRFLQLMSDRSDEPGFLVWAVGLSWCLVAVADSLVISSEDLT